MLVEGSERPVVVEVDEMSLVSDERRSTGFWALLVALKSWLEAEGLRSGAVGAGGMLRAIEITFCISVLLLR